MQEGVSSRLPPISKPDSIHSSRFQRCLRILGVEQFFTTFKDKRKRAVAQRRGMNPFDQGGCWTNCADFWAVPTHLNDESTRGWLESGLRVKGMGFQLGKGGEGKLGGDEVNYFEMWEVPQKRKQSRRVDEEYEAVAQVDEDIVWMWMTIIIASRWRFVIVIIGNLKVLSMVEVTIVGDSHQLLKSKRRILSWTSRVEDQQWHRQRGLLNMSVPFDCFNWL
jgi:hypothetical protein